MDQPLTRWYCDVCGEPIERLKDGHLIWKADAPSYKDHSFKIVHQRSCDLKDHEHSSPLSELVGVDGLANLLALVSLGPLKRSSIMGIKDMNEWVDVVRRLQTPHYEEARRRFNVPELMDAYADSNAVAPYLQRSLISMLQR
jgi:hypothetical protein